MLKVWCLSPPSSTSTSISIKVLIVQHLRYICLSCPDSFPADWHCTRLQVSKNDEIQRFIDSRYISAAEAVWRIFHFAVHRQVPNVVRLQVHLPGYHFVTFDPDEPQEQILSRITGEKTTLTAFFRANANPEMAPTARCLTYQEFPQQFVYNEQKKEWHIRKNGFALGHMYFVPPSANDERFYLRTLLTVVKGPTSFENL